LIGKVNILHTFKKRLQKIVELRESKVCAYPTSTTSRKKHDLLLKSDSAQLLSDSLRSVFISRAA